MATILDSLKGINAYPIPLRTFVGIAEYRNLNTNEVSSSSVLRLANYQLAKADVLLWLSTAPDVSQGGQNYSFTDAQRLQFRNQANAIYREYETTASAMPKSSFGYKGSKL